MKSAFSRFFNLKEKDEDIHVEIETVQDENVEKVLRDEVKQISFKYYSKSLSAAYCV